MNNSNKNRYKNKQKIRKIIAKTMKYWILHNIRYEGEKT